MSEKVFISTPGFRLGYCPELDGLRAVAVLAVMLLHAGSPLMPGGYLGVDIFFVLSGFLISYLLIEEWNRTGSVKLKDFYLRRALRLWPAVLVMLAVTALNASLLRSPTELAFFRRDALSVLLYYANWWNIRAPWHSPALLHAWSLAVEEQFYLVWPVLLLGLLRLRIRRRSRLLMVVLGIAVMAGWRCALSQGSFSVRVYQGTDTHGDALLAGCLVGMIASWNLLPHGRAGKMLLRGAGPFAAVIVGWHLRYCSMTSPYVVTVGYTGVALLIALVICSMLVSKETVLAKVLALPPLRWIGRISYGLYLWNTPVCAAISLGMGIYHPRTQIVLKFGLTFALAGVSFYLVERPFLRLKETLVRRNDGMAAAPRRPITLGNARAA